MFFLFGFGTEKLFTYGSLQYPEIQNKLFGRVLSGTPDTLADYQKSEIEIEGKKFNRAIKKEGEKIEGIVYELNKTQLRRADRYEGNDYKRIRVKLLSGEVVWVYVGR